MKNGSDIQIENGEFSRIHNDILSALAVARFTGSEYRCLLFLLRKTYGWQKKEDDISLSQWAEGTGTDKRQNVLRTLQGLVKKSVIYFIDNGQNRTQTWGFNKYVEQWDSELFPETVIPQDNSLEASVISQDNRTVIPQDNTSVISQDNNKRNYKEKKENTSSSTDEAAPAETTPPTDAGKEKRKTTRKAKPTAYINERTGVSTADIMGAYVKVMEHAEPGASLNYGKEGIGAKRIAAEGWKPGDVVTCFWKMKNDKFWQSKHLSLQTIAEQIGATVGNGKIHNIDGHAPALAVFTGSEK